MTKPSGSRGRAAGSRGGRGGAGLPRAHPSSRSFLLIRAWFWVLRPSQAEQGTSAASPEAAGSSRAAQRPSRAGEGREESPQESRQRSRLRRSGARPLGSFSKHSLEEPLPPLHPRGSHSQETPTSQAETSIRQQILLFLLPFGWILGWFFLLIPSLPGQLLGSTPKLTWPNGKSQRMHPAYCYQNGMLGML